MREEAMTKTIGILAGAASALALMGGAALAAPLEVTLDGVEARGGTLFVSVQTEEQFMLETATDGRMIASPEAGQHKMVFDLDAGDYAVVVWHDDDGDGVFDMGETMPEDGWAMSGKAAGEPAFGDVSVPVGAEGAAVRMEMVYGR